MAGPGDREGLLTVRGPIAHCSYPTCISAPEGARRNGCSTSCATTTPRRSIWSATSSTAGRSNPAGTGRSRTTTWCRSCLRKARKGARIVYVPGNHDEFLRGFYGTHFGGIEVVENAIHDGADGRRYLVIARRPVRSRGARTRAGSRCSATRPTTSRSALNRIFNMIRRRLGFPYWSLSQWAKLKVKNAVNYIGDFEKTLAAEARAASRPMA